LYTAAQLATAGGAVLAVEPALACGPAPNARPIELQHREINAFFHFGVNTAEEQAARELRRAKSNPARCDVSRLTSFSAGDPVHASRPG
jgi:hypothetical protein